MTDMTTGTPALDTELVPAKEGQLAFHAGMSLGQLAKTIAGSGCFGRDVNPYVAAVKILAGNEIGIGPVEAMRGLHVFDGKIELGSAVMASKIKSSGAYDYEVAKCDDEGTILECFEKSHRTGEWRPLPKIVFALEEARKAGLLNKKGPWQTYPADMCFARALSRFFRRYCPHLAGGAVYAEGEVSVDLEPAPKPPRPPSGPERPAPAPTEDAAGEAAIDGAREVAEAATPTVSGTGAGGSQSSTLSGQPEGSSAPPTPPATAGSPTINGSQAETERDPKPGTCPECGCGNNLHLNSCSVPPGPKTETPHMDDGDPNEHPYARFMEQSGELKAGILTADLGVEDRYRSVFTARGLESRASVGRGDTKVQREILLSLHDALKEAMGEKAERDAKASALAEEASAAAHETTAGPGVGMDPDVQPTPEGTTAELPFG
jgi:hypothetical protein